jgi:hypothetical protein
LRTEASSFGIGHEKPHHQDHQRLPAIFLGEKDVALLTGHIFDLGLDGLA